MDKQKQLNLAKDCGFSVPSSIDAFPKDVNFKAVNYPCFVKPRASIYGGKKLAFVIHKKNSRTLLPSIILNIMSLCKIIFVKNTK